MIDLPEDSYHGGPYKFTKKGKLSTSAIVRLVIFVIVEGGFLIWGLLCICIESVRPKCCKRQ